MDAALIFLRLELPRDIPTIGEIQRKAFGQAGEADLVDELRAAGSLSLSMVAMVNGKIVGHIAFSPVWLDQQPEKGMALGLGPMAILPDYQNQGIGLRMLRTGLEDCRRKGAEIVVVLGHAWFYPKAGFLPALEFGILCEYPTPDEAFMVLPLVPDAIQQYAGVAHYHPVFGKVT